MFKKVLDDFKTARKPFVWVCENEESYPFIKEIMPPEEKILTQMILLLDITNREIAGKNKKNSEEDQKTSKKIVQYLFATDKKKKGSLSRFDQYIRDADQKSAKQMLFRLEGVSGLSYEILNEFRKKLKEKYPNITFETGRPLEVVGSGGTTVTQAGLDKKQEELKYIMEVEIPKNSKEIGEAIALGDLSENAEYKYGKEKQAMLNAAVGKLTEEINSAQVFDKSNLDLNKISFGTKVTLLNMDTNQNEKNIISYQAPLADELIGSEVDEELHFEINGTKYNFKVISIEASDLI